MWTGFAFLLLAHPLELVGEAGICFDRTIICIKRRGRNDVVLTGWAQRECVIRARENCAIGNAGSIRDRTTVRIISRSAVHIVLSRRTERLLIRRANRRRSGSGRVGLTRSPDRATSKDLLADKVRACWAHGDAIRLTGIRSRVDNGYRRRTKGWLRASGTSIEAGERAGLLIVFRFVRPWVGVGVRDGTGTGNGI